jgi:hypothetical protein
MVKNTIPRLFLVIFIIYAFFTSTVFAEPVDLLPFEDLTPDSLTGFGDSWNRYAWSMEAYDGDIFVGTWNQKVYLPMLIVNVLKALPVIIKDRTLFMKEVLGTHPVTASKGGEIWKYSLADETWTQVVDNGYNDTFNTGYRISKRYRDAVYFGSANYRNGTQLLALSDHGSTIKVLEPADSAAKERWHSNDSNRTMIVVNDILYIGTENTGGAELWAYDKIELKRVYKFKELSVGYLCAFGNFLFAGMWDDSDMKLYRLKIGQAQEIVQIDDMTPAEFVGTGNRGVIAMEVFNNRLFVSTMNYRKGFSLFYINDPDALPGDPESYRLITNDGFGDSLNMYGWSMKEFDGVLYLGTYNIRGPELWYSTDGENWEVLMPKGFGSKFEWGIRSMVVADQRLFIGTASSIPSSMHLGTPGGLKIFASKKVDTLP